VPTQPRSSTDDIARMMVGNDTPLSTAGRSAEPGEILLTLNNLNYSSATALWHQLLGNINMQLAAGEIVASPGVAGNGQDELLRALSRRVLVAADSLQLGATRLDARRSPSARRLASGVAEERLGRGAVPAMSLTENTLLTAYRTGAGQSGLAQGAKSANTPPAYANSFWCALPQRYRTAAAGQSVGGNLQNFHHRREAFSNQRCWVASHPTGVWMWARL